MPSDLESQLVKTKKRFEEQKIETHKWFDKIKQIDDLINSVNVRSHENLSKAPGGFLQAAISPFKGEFLQSAPSGPNHAEQILVKISDIIHKG